MNTSSAVAQAVMSQLVASGVGELVLAPGSRSAPLAFAAARAVRTGQLRLHVRVDERSAAYLALGLAKVSGEPVALVCTSGTAVANLLPAVVEASYSGIPLLLLTADRPPELRHVGANQTIDQVEIFGANVRFFADVTAQLAMSGFGDSSRESDSAGGQPVDVARNAVEQALVAATAGSASGPAHVNIGFAEPLVPDVDPDDAAAAAGTLTAVVDEATSTRGGSAANRNRAFVWRVWAPGPPRLSTQSGIRGRRARPPDSATPLLGALPLDAVLAALPPVSALPDLSATTDGVAPLASGASPVPARGAIVIGDVPSPDWAVPAVAMAEACGWPVLSEPSGNATASPNSIAHFALLLGSDMFLQTHRPDVLITVGRFGISRPTLALVKSARIHIAVTTPGRDRPDPLHTAAALLDQVPGSAAVNPNANTNPSPGWLASWKAAAARAESVIEDHSRGHSHSTLLDGPRLARLVLAACGPDDLLLLAASRSVRDVQDYGTPSRTAPWIIGNRGASGIDGLTSTAWGAALAHDGRTVALLGDLAFVHDTNGLLAPLSEGRPDLTIVVADNNGGGIFSSLEQGAPRFTEQFEKLFGTPHDLDLVAVARAHGAEAVGVATGDELQHHLMKSPERGAVKVIVARLPDRAREAAIRASLASRISHALDSSVDPDLGRAAGAQ